MTRTRLRPRTAAVLAACLLAALAAADAAACSCVMPGTPEQEMANADAVFTARVVSTEQAEQRSGDFRLQRMKVELALDDVWKGCEEGERAILWTGLGGGDCGFQFEPGERYLVYAYESDDGEQLTTSICSRTRPLAQADEDLAAFGAPKRSVEDAGDAGGEGE